MLGLCRRLVPSAEYRLRDFRQIPDALVQRERVQTREVILSQRDKTSPRFREIVSSSKTEKYFGTLILSVCPSLDQEFLGFRKICLSIYGFVACNLSA